MTAALLQSALAVDIRPADWTERAACRLFTPEEADAVFFPEDDGFGLAAKRVCRGCPVTAQCLLASAGEVGLWAGVGPKQRGRLLGVGEK